MVGRRLLGFVGNIIVRDAKRDVDRHTSAVRRNTRRVLFRPVRTGFSILFMTLLVAVLYTITTDPTASTAVDEAEASGDTLGILFALLPPAPILLAIAAAMIVLVPISLITGGIRRDLRYGRP